MKTTTKSGALHGAVGGAIVGYALAYVAHPPQIFLGQVVILFVAGAIFLGKGWLRFGKERRRETYQVPRLFL
jgi:hypothetical protein